LSAPVSDRTAQGLRLAHHQELKAPPVLAPGSLRVVALGGCGEVGRNMTVFEIDGRLLIVDCGVLFPEDDQPGVDLILPDFSHIADRLRDIEAIVLTHAHEDHIGALPWLLRIVPDVKAIPIVGTKFTLALLANKLREHKLSPTTVEVRETQSMDFGPFSCEFLAVNHSIPDALAVAIKTSAGTVLHTGDFKMDLAPLDGRLTDIQGFERLGAEGVDLLLSDSTNAEVPGFVTSEVEIGPVILGVMQRAKKRVVVASFASHVHRVQQVLDAAKACNRHVAFVGRSMVRNMAVARELGFLTFPKGVVLDAREIEALPADRIVLMCTGSQGEPMAALSRMANRDHPVRISSGDTVILASSLIPGNENAVGRVINRLVRWGADVVHKESALVHVSGHAPAGELMTVLDAVKPSNFMPVHGEWRHQVAHARLGIVSGVPVEQVLVAEDGVVIDMTDGLATITGAVPCGYVYVDGNVVGSVGEEVLRDRKVLGVEGFIQVTVVVDRDTGAVVAGPLVSGKGVSEDIDDLAGVRDLVTKAVEKAVRDGSTDPHDLARVVRRTVGTWAGSVLRRRPMILPLVLEI
jgi:ribonuclease J